ncbi:hypothetical protein TWF506_003213 [Arthrobotrys conoides]|uniref:Uncharacterized protein n=1 Tax=Arthrobotrys conoides TaxID=74498 RepID=A0AAN8RL03_9PEZI
MSFSEFNLQVQQLEDELKETENHIKKLETEQNNQITKFQIEYKTRLERASANLRQFTEYIREVDSLLLEEYSVDYEESELEEYLNLSENIIISLNKTVGQSFRALRNHLINSRKQLGQEEERAAEGSTARIDILNYKIANTQTDIRNQRRKRETIIKGSIKKKEDIVHQRARLQIDLDNLMKLVPGLRRSKNTTLDAANKSAIMVGIGMIISRSLPGLGYGMCVAGLGINVLSGRNASEIQDNLKATGNSILRTAREISRLNVEIEDSISKTSHLVVDLKRFEGLARQVDVLSEKSKSLNWISRQHIGKIVAAKESILAGENKITELGVEIKDLGYAGTREKLPQTLEIVIGKLGEGTSKLGGDFDSSEINDILLMVEEVKLDTGNVLSILNSD